MKIVNRRDLEFVLFELLDAEALTARPRFADHSRETFLAALDTAEAIAAEKFASHNRKADEHEPQFDGLRCEIAHHEHAGRLHARPDDEGGTS